MTDADAILVRVLAESDAILLPIRDWSDHTATNRYFRRADLDKVGVSFRMNSSSEANRKAGERELVELRDAGFLTIARRAKVKFPGVRLTAKGDARARALADLPGRDIGRMFLADVVGKGAKYVDTISGRWCPEIELNGMKGWGECAPEDRRMLAAIELEFLAAATAGWAKCGSSVHGHVAYVATPAGLAELERPSNPPRVGKLPKADPAAGALYRREQDAALAAMARDAPAKPAELGELPMIACMMLMTQVEFDEIERESAEESPPGNGGPPR